MIAKIKRSTEALVAIMLVGLPQMAEAEPIPLTDGKDYHITFASKSVPLELWSPGTAVRIIRKFDYPWVEVEYRWTPQVSFRDGKSVTPETTIIRRYLNLNHVAVIWPDDEPTERSESGPGE